MICPKCNQNIENNDFCPFCGYTFSEKITIIDNEEIEEVEEITSSEKEDLSKNNNPFSFSGRITRLTYLYTNIALLFFYIFVEFLKYLHERFHNENFFFAFIIGMIILAIVDTFAHIKRLRDIKWSPWLILIGFIPLSYVTIIFKLTLLLKKSKYETYKSSALLSR